MTKDEAMAKDEKGRKFRDGAELRVRMLPYTENDERIRINVDFSGTDTAICVTLAQAVKTIAKDRGARAEDVLAGIITTLHEAMGTEINMDYLKAMTAIRRAHTQAKRDRMEQEAEA